MLGLSLTLFGEIERAAFQRQHILVNRPSSCPTARSSGECDMTHVSESFENQSASTYAQKQQLASVIIILSISSWRGQNQSRQMHFHSLTLHPSDNDNAFSPNCISSKQSSDHRIICASQYYFILNSYTVASTLILIQMYCIVFLNKCFVCRVMHLGIMG